MKIISLISCFKFKLTCTGVSSGSDSMFDDEDKPLNEIFIITGISTDNFK